MTSPVWLLDILTVLMLVVAVVSAARLAPALLPAIRLSAAGLIGSRSLPRGSAAADTDIAHLLMCIAMVRMSAPSIKTLPPHAWESIFGILTIWFAWRLLGDAKLYGLRSLLGGHRATHLLHCAVMVFMYAAPATSDSVDMMGVGSGMARPFSYPALVFAFVLVHYSAWDLFGQLWGRHYSLWGGASAGPVSDGDAASAAACRIVMGVAMAFMLLTMS